MHEHVGSVRPIVREPATELSQGQEQGGKGQAVTYHSEAVVESETPNSTSTGSSNRPHTICPWRRHR